MAEEPGLRERKKLERRRCIEAAALDLFDAESFGAVTIDDIAAAADIAPRTFFYYFPTKEDVVLADYAGRLEAIVEELNQRPADEPPWEALRESFLVVAADYEAEREQLIRRFKIIATNPSVFARSLQLQAGWEATVATTLVQREDPPLGDLNCLLFASAALAAMRSSLQHWLATSHKTPLPTLIQECFDKLADGLTTVSPADRC